MKRRFATALTTAALLALSMAAGTDAQTNQGPERTGEKTARADVQSCPIHPEFKARDASKCPKCRAEQRSMKSARDKDKSKVSRRQPQEGAAAND
ncbi:MAG TPA: hypothetical protein VF736_15780 [Pyrinomonadaceae bacterium]|jgi:hypothetical protein